MATSDQGSGFESVVVSVVSDPNAGRCLLFQAETQQGFVSKERDRPNLNSTPGRPGFNQTTTTTTTTRRTTTTTTTHYRPVELNNIPLPTSGGGHVVGKNLRDLHACNDSVWLYAWLGSY